VTSCGCNRLARQQAPVARVLKAVSALFVAIALFTAQSACACLPGSHDHDVAKSAQPAPLMAMAVMEDGAPCHDEAAPTERTHAHECPRLPDLQKAASADLNKPVLQKANLTFPAIHQIALAEPLTFARAYEGRREKPPSAGPPGDSPVTLKVRLLN